MGNIANSIFKKKITKKNRDFNSKWYSNFVEKLNISTVFPFGYRVKWQEFFNDF